MVSFSFTVNRLLVSNRLDGNAMMSGSFGTLVLIVGLPEFGFSISPLIFIKMSKILGILIRKEACMEKIV